MIENILLDYIKFIKTFEDLIRSEYQLSYDQRIMPGMDHPYGKRGKIKDYTYWFHGSGCSLEKDNVECHYDYSPSNNIIFTLWDFKQFITSHPQYKSEELTDKHLELELYKLIEKNFISWEISDRVVLQVYRYIS
ncbi:DUF6896 domain-containing protein [Chryseobacterium sp. SIMBA_038]|uniref:DUF6896 domain-containing protein n=1 Tax=Chryseobacterium sp. SIMBA_038 TaxID=3085780 RepID=UPI00397C6A74